MSIKIHLLSDLHEEFLGYTWPLPRTNCDVLALVGDIGNGSECCDWLMKQNQKLKKPILWILGNHCLYNQSLDFYNEAKKYLEGTNVHLLEKDVFEYKGYRFLGCTFWSNFEAYGPVAKVHAMLSAPRHIADYTYIADFTPQKTIDLNLESFSWLKENLTGTRDIVLTHFPPSVWFTPPQYRGDILSTYFVNDYEGFILERQPLAWLTGHVHHNTNFQIGRTLLVSNCKGYKYEGVKGFVPKLVLEFKEK